MVETTCVCLKLYGLELALVLESLLTVIYLVLGNASREINPNQSILLRFNPWKRPHELPA